MSLRDLLKVDNSTKYTVFGYVRKIETNQSSFHSIPTIVSYLCLQYFWHHEYFDKCGHQLEISNNRTSVTKVHSGIGWMNSCYGKTWIQSDINQIATWTFSITLPFSFNKSSKPSMYFGIVSDDGYLDGNCQQSSKCYGFCDNGQKWCHNDIFDDIVGEDFIDPRLPIEPPPEMKSYVIYAIKQLCARLDILRLYVSVMNSNYPEDREFCGEEWTRI